MLHVLANVAMTIASIGISSFAWTSGTQNTRKNNANERMLIHNLPAYIL